MEDVGERLYHKSTASLDRKRPARPLYGQREADQLARQLRNVDVRDEVDAMYAAVLAAVEADEAPPAALLERDPNASGRGASSCDDSLASGLCSTEGSVAWRPPAGVSPLALGRLRSNTFGSASRGVADPKVRKSDEPGPGSYTPRDAWAPPTPRSARWSHGSRTPRGGAKHVVAATAKRVGPALCPKCGTPKVPSSSSGVLRCPACAPETRGIPLPRPASAHAPGPGEYPVAHSSLSRRGAALPKAATGRTTPEPQATPGPGAYALGAEQGPGYRGRSAFASRGPRLPSARTASPGPLRYDSAAAQDRVQPRAAAVALPRSATGRQPSPTPARDATPGPLSYDTAAPWEQRDRGHIPAARRDDGWLGGRDRLDPERPGPLSYDAPSARPGPAALITAPVRDPAPRMGPGPGEYDPVVDAVRPAAPGVALGAAVRFAGATSDAAPGPGAYDHDGPQAVVGGLIATAPTGRTTEHADPTPGPGAYDVAPQSDPRAPSFGTAYRATEAVLAGPGQDAPGPGAYGDAPVGNVVGAVMGSAPRALGPPPSDTPGPGAFDHAAMGEGSAAVLGTAAARPAPPTETGPGPASYEAAAPPLGADVPGPVLGSAPRGVDAAEPSTAPGPGQYDADDAATRAAVPGAAMPTAVRAVAPKADAAPGPGAYDVPAPDTPGGGVMGTADRPSHVPQSSTGPAVGPATYDAAPPAAAAAPSFGSAARQTTEPGREAAAAVPGPGAYDASSLPDGAAAVIGTARPAAPAPAAPGPGTYDASAPADVVGGHIGAAPRGGGPFDAAGAGPGPGAYDGDDGVVRPAVPGVVMATAARDKDPRDPTPGPGAYATPAEEPGAGAVMGSAAARPAPASSDVPGPQSYAPQSYAVEPAPRAPAMGTSDRFPAAETQDTPGPGTYDAVVPADERGVTLGGAPCDRIPSVFALTPGPAAYDPHPVTGAVPGVRMAAPTAGSTGPAPGPGPGTYDAVVHVAPPGAPFSKLSGRPAETVPDGPGPGHYDAFRADDGPATAMGTAPRDDTAAAVAAALGPGPGSYDVRPPPTAAVSIAPLPSLAALPALPAVPGPAAYTPAYAVVEARAPAAIAGGGTSLRADSAPRTAGPGPGEYTTALPAGTAAVILGRPASPPAVPGLGPGAYDLPDLDHGRAAGIGARHAEAAGSPGPGPGEYSAPLPSGPAALIAPPPLASADAADDTPGPASYRPAPPAPAPAPSLRTDAARFPEDARGAEEPAPNAYLPVLPPGPAVSFPHAGRPDPARPDDNPAPGHYGAPGPALGADAPAFTLHGRPADAAPPEPTPGPTQYAPADDAVRPRAPAFSLGGHAVSATDRELAERADLPGPQHYGVHPPAPRPFEAASGVTIPRATRPRPKTEDDPGPGQYDPSLYAVGPPAPAITIASVPAPPPRTNDGPGPGQYDPAPADSLRFERAPAALVTGKAAGSAEAEGPGPGQYATPGGLSTAGVTISGAPRPEPGLAGADVPGPGMYSAGPAPYGGPAFSFGAPHPPAAGPAADDGPGIGAYNAGPAFDLTRPSAPTYTFGGGRPAAPTATDTMVGPGAYTPGPAPYSTPAWSFGTPAAASGPAAATALGPGEYTLPPLAPGPSHSLGGRHADPLRRDDVPGPGAYHVHDHDPYRQGSPVVDMSKVPPSGGGVAASGPGPGAYQTAPRWGEGGVTMHQRFMAPYLDVTPGPPDFFPSEPTPAFHRPTSDAA